MRPPSPPPSTSPPSSSSSHMKFLSSLKQVEKRLKLDSTILPPTTRPPSFFPIPPPPPPLPFCSNFFSSLNQVEKRLKLDSTIPSTSKKSSFPPIPPPPPPPPDSIYTATQSQSLGSAIYLNFDQPTADTTNSFTDQDSEPPREFISNNSLDFPPTQSQSQSNSLKHLQTTNSFTENEINDIDMLMELLGLSDSGHQEPGGISSGLNCVGDGCNNKDCNCDDGFYTKIVGAKGPKCGKELERLNGWIKHFLGNGNGNGHGDERREAFRLAHLLLAKTAFLSHESGELECFDFPTTVDDFLHNNPPAEVE